MVRANPDGDLHPGEVNVLLLLTIDANGRSKPREWIEDDSIRQLNVVHRGELASWAWGGRGGSTMVTTDKSKQ